MKEELQIEINKTKRELSNLENKLYELKRDEIDKYLKDIRENFVLKTEHIKLLQRMQFEGIFFGDIVSIGVQGKRPFGNSNTYKDIAEILEWQLPNDNLSDEQQKKAERLMNELPIAINTLFRDISQLRGAK